jgi:hypothetical protein
MRFEIPMRMDIENEGNARDHGANGPQDQDDSVYLRINSERPRKWLVCQTMCQRDLMTPGYIVNFSVIISGQDKVYCRTLPVTAYGRLIGANCYQEATRSNQPLYLAIWISKPFDVYQA